ncbi:MAG: tyrosine-type recombinase/integrase [Acidobacteriota bacterium]
MVKDKDKNPKKEKRRGHGEGSISQRKDGRWCARISYKDPISGEPKRHSIYGSSRPEVIAAKKQWEADYAKDGIVPTAKLTVKEWMAKWLETYARPSVRPNTYAGYELVVKKHLIPDLGKHLLKDLRPDHIQGMMNQKLINGNLKTKGPLQARHVEYIYTILHSAMDQAVKNQIIARNPCDAVTKPKKTKTEFMPWTTEQTNTFLKAMRGTRLFPLYMVAWGAGLRRSEILGLQWTDLDLKKGSLTVNRSLVRVKGDKPYKFQDPKTKKSRRTIPLPEQVTKALDVWKKRLAAEELAFPGKDFNTLNLVFCNEAGEPMNPEYISRAFKRDLESVGLPEIRFHDLRHGHATQLLELGEDITVISNRLGHSTITLTADTYSHVRERMQRDASNKLGKVLKI